MLLHIVATLVLQAVFQCSENKLDREVLNNGISYFLGPLLNWTLVGVIRALITEMRTLKSVQLFNSRFTRNLSLSHHRSIPLIELHGEILQNLLQQCPKQVLRLTAASILRDLPGPANLPRHFRPKKFDFGSPRKVAMTALGINSEGDVDPFPIARIGPSLTHRQMDPLSSRSPLHPTQRTT